MRIEVYLDEADLPIQILTPPEKFQLDTTKIEDGNHRLTFKAFDDNGDSSSRTIYFQVQNGPAIAVHGITQDDCLSGEVSILANAYGSNVGDEFEAVRMETPAPIPVWAWVLFLSIFAWGAGYISLEVHNRVSDTAIAASSPGSASAMAQVSTKDESAGWQALGQQVYGNKCASCHQADGSGLPGVFPPLKGNSVVLDDDPAEHIRIVLEGLSGKEIDGVAYASPMPGFGNQLSDEEVAAVVNHERTQWGNNANLVGANDVAELR